MLQAKTIDDIPDHILHDVFAACYSHPAWIKESQLLIDAMGLERDAEYFEKLEEIAAYGERLQFLSGKSKDERVYLLKLVGKWLREGPVQVANSKQLLNMYPDLCAYLDSKEYDDDLGRYYSLYKGHKLENTLPADEEMYFAGFQTDNYDYRYAVLSEALTDDCVCLWIDALGAEWLPLLVSRLKQNKMDTIKLARVVQATLPTETCFNDQWNRIDVPHKKLDRLDKLAHKGVIDEPDYYTCVEEQLSFVAGIQKKVDELLKQYDVCQSCGRKRLVSRG